MASKQISSRLIRIYAGANRSARREGIIRGGKRSRRRRDFVQGMRRNSAKVEGGRERQLFNPYACNYQCKSTNPLGGGMRQREEGKFAKMRSRAGGSRIGSYGAKGPHLWRKSHDKTKK